MPSSDFYNNKKILVTGGTGLIGQPLVEELIKKGAFVTVVSLDDKSRSNKNVKFIKSDLRYFENCLDVCKNKEIVFHLAGVKGSPEMTAKQPASFFFPTISFSFNMMEAARRMGVEQYLLTSSIGVYAPSKIFYEDDVWNSFPSPHDRFAGWAKRMCELQAESYSIEYKWDKVSIVRPANVYGPFDNFDPKNAMVIPSLILRALSGENPLKVWGDGSAIRDFIYSRDVALGMMKVVERGFNKPINIGSGKGITIKEIVEIIIQNTNQNKTIEWDTSKPSGDSIRIMDTSTQKKLKILNETSIEEGIKETIEWFKKNQHMISNRYNSFTEFKSLYHF